MFKTQVEPRTAGELFQCKVFNILWRHLMIFRSVDRGKKEAQKEGGGGEITHFTSPGSAPAYYMQFSTHVYFAILGLHIWRQLNLAIF